MRTMSQTMLLLASLTLLAASGCDDSAQAQAQAQVQTRTSVSTDDFDLETVVGLLKTEKVTNASDLETAVNNGLSNVDLDKDGKRDHIGVKETQSGTNRILDFLAFPSGEVNPTPVTVASINFNVVGNQLNVSGGYPDYVRGYDRAYYSYSIPYGPTFGDMLFYSWLFAPRPVYVYRPYVSVGYSARPVFAPATFTSMRTTYRTETRVSPVARQAPPPTFKVNYASQAPSRYVSKPAATSTRLSDRAGGLSNFTVRDTSKARPTGTAFGASAPSAPSRPTGTAFGASAPSAPSRPSSFGSSWSSRPSAPSAPSRSFGSSSSSRSFGSSSSSRSGGRR